MTKKQTVTCFPLLISADRSPADFICYLLFARTASPTSYEDLKCTLRPAPVSEFSSVFRKRQLSRRDTFLCVLWATNYTSAVATRACRSSNAHKLHLFSPFLSFFPPYRGPPSYVCSKSVAMTSRNESARNIVYLSSCLQFLINMSNIKSTY